MVPRTVCFVLVVSLFVLLASPSANASCPSGQEHWTDGGCYLKCPDGSKRTGPASCESIGIRTDCTDYGMSGTAPTASCPVGSPTLGLCANGWSITTATYTCPAGQEYYGSACYKGCPNGGHHTAACTCDNYPVTTTSEVLYGRAGPPLACTPSANISANQPLDITFYVTSDLHFHESSEYTADSHQGHVLQINKLKDVKWPLWQGFVGSASGKIGPPVGVVINGDYTHYGHEKELGIFREFYERGRKRSDLPFWITADPDIALVFWKITTPIDYPTWVGFGNHELMGDGGADRNRSYIASKMAVGCGDVVNRHSQTAAYSWNWGKLHLIQVNALGDDSKPTGFEEVMTWLQDDLFQNAKDKRPVIVFSHYALRGAESGKNLNGTYLTRFVSAFDKYNVIAMFAGHDHVADLDESRSFPVFRSATGGQTTYKVPSGIHAVHVTEASLDVAYFEWCTNNSPAACPKGQTCPLERCVAAQQPHLGMYSDPVYNATYSLHKTINGVVATSETIIDDQAITTSYAPPSGGECDTPPLACPAGSNLYGTSVGGFCCYGATDGNTCSTLNMCALDPTRPQNQPLCCPTGMNLYGMGAGGFCCAGAIGSGGNTCTTNEVCALDPARTQGYNVCTSLRCPPGMNFYGASKGGFCCNGTVSASGDTCSTSDVCALDASRPQGNRVCGSRCLSRGPGCNTSIAAGQCAFAASNAVEQCRKHPQCTAVTCNKSTGWCFARDTTQLGPWTGFASIFVQKDIPAGPLQDQAVNCGPGGCISSGPGCDTSAVPGQCSFPRAQAVELCSKHPQCVAVVCNQSRSDCQARDTLERAPWRGMNSTLLTRLEGQAISCGPGGCIASGPGCDTSAVPGQCSFPKGSALESCRKHPQCKAVICNSLRTDCQARDTTEHVPWSGFTSYIVDKR